MSAQHIKNNSSGIREQLKISVATLLILGTIGCDDFDAAPVKFTQDDVISVGDVQTLEIRERVLTSLPESAPAVNPLQAELGRLLFWDPILSGDRDVACATCHLPEFGYSDNLAQAIGVGGQGRGTDRLVGHTGRVRRNSQTVLNTVWNGIDAMGTFNSTTAPMFWDNREASLEAQALGPLRSREEMRGDNIAEGDILAVVETRLNGIPAYQRAFSEAFGTAIISAAEVTQALANFQRTLVANNSPFDQWMRGEPGAMSDRQVSGMQEFVIAGCADCHSGPLFSDFTARVLGVQEGAGLTEPDAGDGNFGFRTPTLRQLSSTAPYFHAGQFNTLGEVINFYDEPGGSSNPNVPSRSVDPEFLDVPEMDDGRGAIILEFLEALNDDSFDKKVPPSVPSGLPVGGF